MKVLQGKFRLVSEYKPAGDQPQAVDKLVSGIQRGYRFQTLLGATGTGKTYTMANVIERVHIFTYNTFKVRFICLVDGQLNNFKHCVLILTKDNLEANITVTFSMQHERYIEG